MAKAAESIAQGGLYDVRKQANNNFPQNNRDLSAWVGEPFGLQAGLRPYIYKRRISLAKAPHFNE
jgi:hypothetical protein